MSEVTLQFEIVTPERLLHSQESQFVVIPGVDGEIGALPNHSPLLTSLRAGEVSSEEVGGVARFVVSAGIGEVLPERVTLIVTHAAKLEQIDYEASKQELAATESDLTGRVTEDPEYPGLIARRDFAQACMDALQRKMASGGM